MRCTLALLLIAAPAACGVQAALKPRPGGTLPAAPYGRDDKLTAEALLETTTQAIPERSVELRKRSEPRADDPFDLPPDE